MPEIDEQYTIQYTIQTVSNTSNDALKGLQKVNNRLSNLVSSQSNNLGTTSRIGGSTIGGSRSGAFNLYLPNVKLPFKIYSPSKKVLDSMKGINDSIYYGGKKISNEIRSSRSSLYDSNRLAWAYNNSGGKKPPVAKALALDPSIKLGPSETDLMQKSAKKAFEDSWELGILRENARKKTEQMMRESKNPLDQYFGKKEADNLIEKAGQGKREMGRGVDPKDVTPYKNEDLGRSMGSIERLPKGKLRETMDKQIAQEEYDRDSANLEYLQSQEIKDIDTGALLNIMERMKKYEANRKAQ